MPPGRALLLSIPFLLLPCALRGDGTIPKPKASGYPVHGASGGVTVGAEYTIHSFSGQGQTFVAPGYLVVEVALYPRPGGPVDVNAGHFSLRVNGKKMALLPQSPGMVAASLKYPDWEQYPNAQARVGLGAADVILGRPRTAGRFPDGQRPNENRLPQPPRSPEPESGSSVSRPEPVKAEDVVVSAALPEGPARTAVSGYLYFAYRGKISRIKSLELLFHDAVLKLQ